jgi:lipid-binding SYLF domain-containing protein
MEKKTTRKENTMNAKTVRVVILSAVVALYLGLLSCATAPLSPSDKAVQQESVRAMASQTLADLYKTNPDAKSAIANAAGYAVFSDFGFKLMFMGGAKGAGVAINNASKQDTFMKMAEFQPGLGLGAEKYRIVFVFDTPAAFNSFITSGWEAGANTMAAARTKTKGGALAGAVSVSDGVSMFQVDTQGAIVGVSITGAKFYKDKELN